MQILINTIIIVSISVLIGILYAWYLLKKKIK